VNRDDSAELREFMREALRVVPEVHKALTLQRRIRRLASLVEELDPTAGKTESGRGSDGVLKPARFGRVVRQ
jgi:hypothetical protein